MIKFLIAQGVGFSPGSIKYMPTLGFSIGAALVLFARYSATGFDYSGLSFVGSDHSDVSFAGS